MIPYGRQLINEEDIQAVVKVLRSDFLTQGPVVPEFEKKVCDYAGSKHAIAVNSGTSALHIACLALDLGVGDWLWTTPITFVASANCGLYCGAQVDFVDIDPDTWNISVKRLEEKLIQARKNNSLPKVLVAVHLCGLSCEMKAIYLLSKEFGFRVIEDACHAMGGRYEGRPIGDCRYSDITIFSFHPVKTITCGEGGIAVTNDENLSSKMRLLRSHGITRDAGEMNEDSHGPWYYEQIGLGFNYRLTDIQAALGISQLGRLDEFVTRRHEIAASYNAYLAGLPICLPKYQDDNNYSGLHLYVVRLKVAKINKSHRQFVEEMRERGVLVNLHYIPVHFQPWYKKMGFAPGDFPEAEKYYSEALSLPIYPRLTDSQIQEVVKVFKKCLN